MEQFGFELREFQVELLESNYRFPVMDEKDQVFRAYVSLTKFIIETLDKKQLKKELLKCGLLKSELKDLGSLKLLSLFISKVLKYPDTEKLMTPLFVLNDFRVLESHFNNDSFDEKYQNYKERLGVAENTNYLNTFKRLIDSLVQSIETLINTLKCFHS